MRFLLLILGAEADAVGAAWREDAFGGANGVRFWPEGGVSEAPEELLIGLNESMLGSGGWE